MPGSPSSDIQKLTSPVGAVPKQTPPPRVLYSFDTISDVRFVDGFSSRLNLALLTPGGGPALLSNPPSRPVPHFKLPGGRWAFVWRSALWLIKHRRAYDVVFVLDNLTAALGANLAGLVTKRPVVQIEGRTTVEYYQTKRGKVPLWRYALGLAAVKSLVWLNYRLVTVVAPCTRSIAAVSKGSRTHIIPWYGIDTDAFARSVSKEQARQELDLPKEAEIVFYRSRIAPEKDPETFLRAVQELSDQGRDVVALYVGGEYREFMKMASAHSFPSVARGHVHPIETLPKYYQAADVLVQTSRAEGLALSTLEALACELPVVASATGGLFETIRPDETGILAPVGDAPAVAAAVRTLLEDHATAERLAKGGRQMVEREYSARVAFEAWEQLARSLA